MASVDLTEEDFQVLASAARRARDEGQIDAIALDIMARKANAALAHRRNRFPWSPTGRTPSIHWSDVPSTLEEV